MIDFFSLAITHGLLALAAWRLLFRADLDRDPVDEASDQPTAQKPKSAPRA